MAISPTYVINSATLDLQYERGAVYYDKCGSLMLKLQDALGAPKFSGSVPTMAAAELRSDVERFVIQYGPRNLTVSQAWMPSLARFEQLAPVAWSEVSQYLDVARHVTRCGVRFWLLWKAGSFAEAQGAVQRLGLLNPSDHWRDLFGQISPHAVVAMAKDSHATLRLAVDVSSTNVQGELSPSLAAMIPKHAILLDLDHSYPGSAGTVENAAEFALNGGQLKDFVRASWERSRTVAATLGRVLGAQDAGRDEGNTDH